MLKKSQVWRGFAFRSGALALVSAALVACLAVSPAAALSTSAGVSEASVARAGVFSQKPYVALGDSFTAGQGSPPYTSEVCKQSKLGYPTIAAALTLYRLTDDKSCSGATVADTTAQLVGVSDKTQLVTLTVGGIDAGSNAVLAACATNPDPTVDPCKSVLAASISGLAQLGPKLVGLYSTIAQKLPQAKIVVLNYPRLFTPGLAPLGDLINASTDALNSVIAGAVAATANPRVQLVDVTQEFSGHGIGARIPYIALDPTDLAAPKNFHPNVLGNALGYALALANDRVFSR